MKIIKVIKSKVENEYVCIESFSVSLVDGLGFSTDEEKVIEKDSIWFIPENEDYRFIGGQIRLESKNLDWIEITEESFKKCFKRR